MTMADVAPMPVEHYPKYPPFPKPPAGKTIKPFVQFQPEGIRLCAGTDKVEVDALGIPTLKLNVQHLVPSATKKGKKTAKATIIDEATGHERKIFWHEEWEQREQFNIFACDP